MKMTWMMKLLTATLITLSARAAEPDGAPARKDSRATENRKAAAKAGITDIQYFAQDRNLKVSLSSGRTYVYTDVPPELAEQFAVSERKQEFLDRRIRPEYDLARTASGKEPSAQTRGTKAGTAARNPPEAKGEGKPAKNERTRIEPGAKGTSSGRSPSTASRVTGEKRAAKSDSVPRMDKVPEGEPGASAATR